MHFKCGIQANNLAVAELAVAELAVAETAVAETEKTPNYYLIR